MGSFVHGCGTRNTAVENMALADCAPKRLVEVMRCPHDVYTKEECFECTPKVPAITGEKLPERVWISGPNILKEEPGPLAVKFYGPWDAYVPESLLQAARQELEEKVREARAKAFEEAAKEVSGWRDLIEDNHRQIINAQGYKNPQEAGREYRNQDNLLGVIQMKLIGKAKAASGSDTGRGDGV